MPDKFFGLDQVFASLQDVLDTLAKSDRRTLMVQIDFCCQGVERVGIQFVS